MRLLLPLFTALAALPALAGNVYKWTDAKGQVHYSQTPPPEGAVSVQSTERFKTAPGGSSAPSAPPAAPSPAPAPAPAKGEKSPPVETAEAKAKRCAASKERLAFLAENIPRRIMIQNADGTESRMTEEQHAEGIQKAQEAGKGC